MKSPAASLALLALLVLSLPLACGAAPQGAAKSSAGAQVFKGQFRWNQGDAVDELRAEFTPKGEGLWEVAFSFDYRGPHTYVGQAEGTLAEGGSLKGEVEDERGRRHFKFWGAFKSGRFEGQHSELRGREEEATGSLTLFR